MKQKTKDYLKIVIGRICVFSGIIFIGTAYTSVSEVWRTILLIIGYIALIAYETLIVNILKEKYEREKS